MIIRLIIFFNKGTRNSQDSELKDCSSTQKQNIEGSLKYMEDHDNICVDQRDKTGTKTKNLLTNVQFIFLMANTTQTRPTSVVELSNGKEKINKYKYFLQLFTLSIFVSKIK